MKITIISKVFLFFLFSTILMADTSLYNRSIEDMLEDIKKRKKSKHTISKRIYRDEWMNVLKEEKQDTLEIDFRKLEIRRIKPTESKL